MSADDDITASRSPMNRRSFLSFLTVAAGAAAGALVGVPVVGRLLAPLRPPGDRDDESGAYRSVGPVASFDEDAPTRVGLAVTVRDGWTVTTQERAAWVVRTGPDSVRVMSVVCPHLGCAVKWAAQRGEFACPCHRSGFALDGARQHGPARRGLDELPTRIVAGDVQVKWVDYAANVAEKRPVGGESA